MYVCTSRAVRRGVNWKRVLRCNRVKPAQKRKCENDSHTSMRGNLERGAIWNARLFAHRRLCIFSTFLSFQLFAEKPQPTRSAFGFFQATGSEEVLLDCEFRRDRELLDRPKAFKFTGEFHRNFLKGFFWLAAPKIGELILSKKHSK